MDFQKFNKIPRLSRDCIITEKIDGTNAQVVIISHNDLFASCADWEISLQKERFSDFIDKYSLFKKDDIYMFAGSRTRWLDTSSKGDNFGFAKWVQENAEELLQLGEGRHFGEWYGKGIQRGYGLNEKRFSLFNVGKWASRKVIINEQEFEVNELKEDDKRNFCPKCCEVVPVLWEGIFDTVQIDSILNYLKINGSLAVPDFMNPEGVVIFHSVSGQLFKKTIEGDEKPKGI